MSKQMWLLLAVMLPLFSGCVSETEFKSQQAVPEINRNLSEINRQVAEIRQVNQNLQQTNQNLQQLSFAAAVTAQSVNDIAAIMNTSAEIDLDALREINLPTNPSQEQVQEYIRLVIIVSNAQSFKDRNDPQVRMLAKVGRANLPLLLAYQDDFYAATAVGRLATQEDKELILKSAKANIAETRLLPVIVSMGWATELKTILLQVMQADCANPEVIAAAVSLRDRDFYPALTEYLVNSADEGNTSKLYETLKTLPGINLAPASEALWNQFAATPDSPKKDEIASIAADCGNLAALEYLAERLANPEMIPAGSIRFDFQCALWRLTKQSGNAAAVAAWLKTNRGKISYDPATKVFVVK